MAEKFKINLSTFFEVGENKVKNIHEILSRHDVEFQRVLLLGDRKTFLIGGETIAADFRKKEINVLKHLVANSNEINIQKVKKLIHEKKPELIIGFGGGKVMDVAKLAAGKTNVKFISIPTILSNDGISSPVSVIKNKDNIPISHITKAPYGVIVDINIIKKAPIRHIRAGVGDMISNLSAVFDARLAQSKGKENLNTTALLLAEAGPTNLFDFEKDEHLKSNEFLLRLARGLIKSGFAMCIVGSSRPASGSEHKISHAMDHLYSPRKALHGEQVGVATLFTMALQENEYFDNVRKLYTQIHFPQKLKKLFLNSDQFIKAVHNATRIRPQRYTILEDKKLTTKEIRKIIREINL
jgi:glycerol-1-phosphate dehydrogenase [NAD(P)+]